ncbi:MAG: ABC transporter substrate-binding protein [Chloroflexi bacterium]|nr:ABC transporter substrate-binding protein [Chloroflexota bacterium]
MSGGQVQNWRSLLGCVLFLLVVACAPQTPSAPAPTPVGKPVEAPKPTPVAKTVEKVKLQVTARDGSFINYYLPQDKGFYKEEGIDLDIIPIKATLSIPSLLAGEIDYIGQVGGPFEAGLMGAPIRIMASFKSRAIWYLYGAPGVTSPEDLKGKSVAVSSVGSSNQYAAKMALKSLGLDPDKDVTFVAIPDKVAMFAALKAKTVAAANVGSPYEMLAREAGLKLFVFTGDILQIPLTGISTIDTKVKENPGQIKKMIKASLRGLLDIRDHPEDAIRFLMKEFGLDEKIARATYEDGLRSWSYDGTISQKGLEQAVEQGRTMGSLKKAVTKEDIDKVVDFSILKEVQKEMGLAQ